MYYQNQPKFNGVCLRSNLPKIMDGAYVINLDEFKLIETHWIVLYANDNNIIYFESFGVGRIPEKSKDFIGNKNIMTNVYRIQAYNSVMYGYFCIGFIVLALKDNSLLDYTNLFSPSKYEKNDKIILKYFQ